MSRTEIRIPTRRKILYTAILALVLLFLCEAGLRTRQWIRYGTFSTGVRDPMLVYDNDAQLFVPRPGYEAKGGRIHIKINSLGFRGDEISREKPANTIRIVCLGASTTFSAEASSNDATWPHRLQELMQRAYPAVKVEVINAAVGGYVSADNLKNLRSRVLPLDPDLVIYYEANNEIVHDTRELAQREGLLSANEGRQPHFAAFASKYSLLFDLAYKNLAIAARSRTTNVRTLDRVPPDLPAHFVGVLDQMRGELASRDVPFVLSTFIVKYRRNQDRATQIANADVAFYYMPWMSIDGMLDAMDVYNDAIVKFAAANQLPIVDDRDSIPPDASHFSDCMHLLDKGNDVMAGRFHAFLARSGLIDRVVKRMEATRSADQ